MSGYGTVVNPATPSTNQGVAATKLRQLCENARPEQPRRRPVYGSWIMFPGPGLARVIATIPGNDWILLDMEHGAIGDAEMHNILPAVIGTGCTPLVRVPAPENAYIKRALDAGAAGLMFPMIETREQAEAVVRMCKFPPQGTRGVGSPFASTYYGLSGPAYQDKANDATMVIVQIETPLGLKNALDIASVPGVDMLFIGPNDLACSMGNGSTNHYQIPQAQEAIEQIRKATEQAGKLCGIYCVNAEQAHARFQQGFQLINIGGDINAILTWMSTEISKAQTLLAA